MPTLILHVADGKIVPISGAALLSAKLFSALAGLRQRQRDHATSPPTTSYPWTLIDGPEHDRRHSDRAPIQDENRPARKIPPDNLRSVANQSYQLDALRAPRQILSIKSTLSFLALILASSGAEEMPESVKQMAAIAQ